MTALPLILVWVLVLLITRWFALMAAVVAAAGWRRLTEPRRLTPIAPSTRFLFVIPAHDEAAVIGITVRSCAAVNYDPTRFQIAVIADNCTDATADVAREADALVTVRSDPDRKSKGFALEDFFRGVAHDPAIREHDAYVLVDADTSVAPDLLLAFDQSIRRGDDFIQGYYSVRNADASWRTRLLTYAFSLANGVWLAGLDRLGLSVGLKGNGMCFRAAALRRFPWQAHGLVEDMEFAWNLRLAGERVRFQPLAVVYGEMVSRGGAGAASQRRRWESGRRSLRTTVRQGLWQASRLSWGRKLVYQTDLDYPPLGRLAVSLALISLLTLSGGLWAGWSRAWLVTSAVLAADWLVLLIYALSPLVVMNLPLRHLASLLHLPYYLGWKLSLGLLKAPTAWVRTPREATATDPPTP